MKKFCLLFFISCCGHTLSAQKRIWSPTLTMGEAYNTYDTRYAFMRSKIMFNLGLNAGIELNSHILFYSGLNYAVYQYAYEYNLSRLTASQQISSSFLNIPIGMIVSTNKARKVGFAMDVNLGLNFNLNNTETVTIGNITTQNTTRDNYVPFISMLNIYPSVNIPLGARTKMLIGPGVNISLKNQYENTTLSGALSRLNSDGGRISIISYF